MEDDVYNYCNQCIYCRINKAKPENVANWSLARYQGPFKCYFADHITGLEPCQGYKVILSVCFQFCMASTCISRALALSLLSRLMRPGFTFANEGCLVRYLEF